MISLPSGTTVRVVDGSLEAQGPKGLLTLRIPPSMEVVVGEESIAVRPKAGHGASFLDRALWGTTWSLVRNAVVGVSEAFQKQLELQGVGYRAELSGSRLKLFLGFTHSVDVEAPSGVTFRVEKNIITVSGVSKYAVGETAASIRRLRPPEPYKGTGVRTVGEVVRRKAGKTAGAGTTVVTK